MKKRFLIPVLALVLVAVAPEGTVIPKADLPDFYACWFESPYEYMFTPVEDYESTPNGIGQYVGGVRGIMKYGGLYSCMVSYNQKKGIEQQDPDGPFSDNWHLDIEAFAGMKVVLKSEKGFDCYNPEIVKWGSRNLVPSPDQPMMQFTFQQVYDRMFSRFFRLMVATHQWLDERKAWEKEKQKYFAAVTRDEWGGVSYLEDRFRGTLSEFDVERDGSSWTVSMGIGFWLRRHHDGTEDELWEALKMMMVKYDPEFIRPYLKQ